MAQSNGEADREHYEQPHPGSTGSERERGSQLPVEPEVDAPEEGDGEDSQPDQESKHSYPTSDPPANY